MAFAEGFKKVGRKARRGRWKRHPTPHKDHRKKLPSPHDREHATERRMRLLELRAHDYGAELD